MQALLDLKKQKKALIEEATHGLVLTNDEKKVFVWLYHQDLFTVTCICNVVMKARAINAKTK